MALNILNEKIYIFLWFWFIILAILSACAILYSALVVMLPTTREAIIKRRFRNGTTNEVEGLISNIQVIKLINISTCTINVNSIKLSLTGRRFLIASFAGSKYKRECFLRNPT